MEILCNPNDLLNTLEIRFKNNIVRHHGLDWEKVKEKMISQSEKLRSLSERDRTGGEPDVVGFDEITGAYNFYDCSV
jgi:hypothetical protein